MSVHVRMALVMLCLGVAIGGWIALLMHLLGYGDWSWAVPWAGVIPGVALLRFRRS